ncbi:MAG: hypothetical protein AB7I19_12725 [Planctomycetota bacterium]
MTALLRVVVSLLSLSIILVIVFWESGARISPGPLSASHARIDSLDGAIGCEKCHVDGSASFTSSCEACHTEIASARSAGRGLHGKLSDSDRCERCHTEHVSIPTAVALARQFALAGIADPTAYRHAEVDHFELVGAHQSLDCKTCHALAAADSISAEESRFLGLSQRCASCHEDVHRGEYGAACADCHGQTRSFSAIADFRHAEFQQDGRHAALSCTQCHDAEGPRSIAALLHVPASPRSCSDCHRDPHSGPDTTLRLTDSRDCSRCHSTSDFRDVDFGAPEHAAIGVALAGRHATTDCRHCHGDGIRTGAAESPSASVRRDMSKCTICHDSPHVRIDSTGDCSACHSPEAQDFRLPAARLSVAQHAEFGMALEPPHEALTCAHCHDPSHEYSQRFADRRAERCDHCHRDPHAGQFDIAAMPADCRRCHAPLRFVPPAFDGEAHASTAFPLRGAHRGVACNDCHVETPEGTRGFRGTSSNCVACHSDIHHGQFDGEGDALVLDGRHDCARCHDESGFRALRSEFDHARWTGYELAPAHRSAACTDCHGRSADAPPGSRSLGKAPTACADCHQDPHAGQFARDGRTATDCARCHTAQSTFGTPTFDHDRDSRFPLDGEHRQLECSACHTKTRTADGASVTRYRPLGTDCRDCHGTWRGRR